MGGSLILITSLLAGSLLRQTSTAAKDNFEEVTEKVTKKLLKQICFNENPTQIPACGILHVAVLVMTGFVMDSARAFKISLKWFGLGVLCV